MYNNKLVFIAACLGLFLFGMVAITLGSVLPEITVKFGVNKLQAGALTSLLFVGYLIGSLIFGPIADRYGYKWLFLVCGFLILVSLEGIAFGYAWWMIQLSVLVVGAAGGALNGATSGIVADISEASEKGSRLSALGIFYGLGAIMMPLILAGLSPWFSRETIFIGIGIFIVGLIVYFWSIVFPAPKQNEGIPLKEIVRLLKSSSLLFVGTYLLFQSGIEGIINNWITSFLQAQPDVLPKTALLALTIHMVAMTTTRLVLSRLLKRYAPYKVLIVSYCMIFMGGCILWLYPSYFGTILALVFMGIGLAGGFPIILAQVGVIYSEVSGTAFSIVLTISLLGGICLSYLMGLVAHQFGIEALPSLLLASITFLGGALFFLKGIYNQKNKNP